MTAPRGLTPEEAAIWRRVTATVKPLHPGKDAVTPALAVTGAAEAPPAAPPPRSRSHRPQGSPAPRLEQAPPPPQLLTHHGLDGSWERRLTNAQAAPELTIDLHGLNLAQAHSRVMAGLAQAAALGARVVLVVAGKPRPHAEHGALDFAGRSERRGAIRAKLLDWLAASEHAARIAAVRPAHPRHGGAGAVYVVLRRGR